MLTGAIRVTHYEKLRKLAEDNNGTITSRLLDENRIQRMYIRKLIDEGFLLRSARGVYITAETSEDEMFMLQSRFAKGIFSYGSALFLHNLTDRTPLHCTMTFPQGYNTSKPKASGIKPVSAAECYYEAGISEAMTPVGNIVRLYDQEKTVCDIIRNKKHIDAQIAADAIKRYARRRDRNIPRLAKYAKLLGIEDEIRKYPETLL
jgi:predicted transcriptional regulator of viral defense system